MKKLPLLILIMSLSVFRLNAQFEYRSFFDCEHLPYCYIIDSLSTDELLTAGEIFSKHGHIYANYDRQNEVLILQSDVNCDDVTKLHIKRLTHNQEEYMFVFKEKDVNKNTYGKLKLYQYQDGKWIPGRKIEMSWQRLFNVSEKDLNRLRQLGQYPEYMVKFRSDHFVVEIPWGLYTYGEGSDIDGFSKSRGKQPIKFSYTSFIQ